MNYRQFQMMRKRADLIEPHEAAGLLAMIPALYGTHYVGSKIPALKKRKTLLSALSILAGVGGAFGAGAFVKQFETPKLTANDFPYGKPPQVDNNILDL